ncbi:cellobiose phosphorylase [Roseimicrobium gellanilyticum]|uniref:Cellobiose phosphorylase n=1 Tax=Roseimicrobium gellanilyticum TaxID=748857 RepID=A0A366HTT8_9BACT|nr:amylo-alpha-1,6-glucosidase [Roseimicrobium gellanilyticum]RBP47692.1 cellobiose phosphorylase [Roseimicrobium gellanilyticum]
MTPTPSSVTFPFRAASPSGLSVELNANGSIRRIDHGDIMINLFLGNEAEGGPANIFLRLHGESTTVIPLIGPCSSASYRFEERGMTASGRWGDLTFRLRLVLAESSPAWFWHVEVENHGMKEVACDLVYVQDIALAHYGAIRLNEYYVSQYLDHTALDHASKGVAVASRQNQSMGGRCPWTVIGSLGWGVSYATDALQSYGFSRRTGAELAGLAADLPGKRLQHEHSMVGIQDERFVLQPGANARRGFFSWFESNKSEATSPKDRRFIESALTLPESACPPWPADATDSMPACGLFASAPFLEAVELAEDDINAFVGPERRDAEYDRGHLLSFFTGKHSHVVLKRKELQVLRPHGHLLRTGGVLTPDESALASTAWMGGVFHSMVTQGHVSINRFLSTCHTYLGLFRSHGQRIFIELEGEWVLLGVPSAFEMRPGFCRWWYKHRAGVVEVTSVAPDDRHELLLSVTVLAGAPARLLISHHIAMNGDDGSSSVSAQYKVKDRAAFVRAIPESDVGRRFPEGEFVIKPSQGTQVEGIGGDEMLFADGVSRKQPFLCFATAPALSVAFSIEGRLVPESHEHGGGFWDSIGAGLKIEAPSAGEHAARASQLAEIFPWFIHNALVHYLSPRGLEQYSGGGWGTRDVCQGPVELLLALGRFEPVRDLLCRVFRQQNADGDWPQWFMFFDRERGIRPGDSHGDIVYWPLVALAQYLSATGDADLLEERLPFFHPEGDVAAETCTVAGHVERALDLIQRRVIPGTRLAAYGHGDWNDSLQPAKPDMRERLCSAWTVTLNYQTLVALANAFRTLGDTVRAKEFEAMASAVLDEFQHTLIVDDVVAGLAYFHEGGRTDYLLHPGDEATGLSYSLLPMIHAIINDMFAPQQAAAHLELIRRHLLGPDGAHLFDRPLAYRGGIQTYFQRAESASYFGREIGIMYTHAHLRYCEALARYGDAEAFFHALCQANPIAIRQIVPSAGLRQANCYYSSSDPAFADRYEAFEHYEKVNLGEVALEGGWRVYSSGAGIATRLIMQCFLGIRVEKNSMVVDAVMPASLDGLQARLQLYGRSLVVLYRVGSKGCGVMSVEVNGTVLDFTREPNPYRPGAVRIPLGSFTSQLTGDGDRLAIVLG